MKRARICLGVLLVGVLFAGGVSAQLTTGVLQGKVSDATGAVLPNVEVKIISQQTGATRLLTTTGAGFYNAENVPAGAYTIAVEASGFKAYRVTDLVVEVGQRLTWNITLEVGAVVETVEVIAGDPGLIIDTSSSTVDSVITTDIIEFTPQNGRNFLQLAGQMAGIQLVDGGSFDPTKNQFIGVSVGGRSGRVTRIQVDGIDITDETVGTTVQNLPQDSIQEFQISVSSLDASTSLTSSGAINIITRRGGNEFHGSGFVFARTWRHAARPTVGVDAPFDRQEWGARAGGPIIPDKLFIHGSWERVNQDGTTFTSNSNFTSPSFNAAAGTPFDGNTGVARLDWEQARTGLDLFARFSHDSNRAATGFGGTQLQPFDNVNVTNIIGGGADYRHGNFTHSWRYGRVNFDNTIVPASPGGVPATLDPGGRPVTIELGPPGRSVLATGPNRLAPQSTLQVNDQAKYDGSYVFGQHALRYGAEVNSIEVNLFASFFGAAPTIRGIFSDTNRAAIIARGGDPQDPLEYPVNFLILGNGLGAFTEVANRGIPSGGVNNNRWAFYIADSWRPFPNFTVNLGLRYDFESGQTNDDIPRPAVLETLLGPGESGSVPADDNNWAPQIGFAWDPTGSGKTVIRAGAGLFYETNVFNNIIFERTEILPVGLGFAIVVPPFTGVDAQGRVTVAGQPISNLDTGTLNGQPIGAVIDDALQLQALFQAAFAAVPFDRFGLSSFEQNGETSFGEFILRDYDTPYATQINVGIQRELQPGLVVSADYTRTNSVHTFISRDANRQFAADTLDPVLAQAAVDATTAGLGCPVGDIDCAITMGADITDFGLVGRGSAFDTVNRAFGPVTTLLTGGRAEYNALILRLRGLWSNVGGVLPGITLNTSYTLSRFETISSRLDFLPGNNFNDAFLQKRNFGPSILDRTHQAVIQTLFDLPLGLHVGVNNRIATAFPQTLTLPTAVGGNNEIFFSDLDGDGTTNDFLPGTQRGSFGRDISSILALNQAIGVFNGNVAGTITPAGQALVDAGIFSQAQLVSLGAVVQPISLAPENQVLNDSFINTDVRLSKTIDVSGLLGRGEGVEIIPTVEVFNIFNIANFGRLSGNLNGGAGTVNGTPPGLRSNRLGLQSGSFAQGLTRAVQWSVRVNF